MAEHKSLVSIDIGKTDIVVRPLGWYKLWSFKSELRIPRAAIAEAHVARRATLTMMLGLRMPGTSLPGVITAGTYVGGGSKQFWVVGRAEYLLVLDLREQPYQRVVVQLENAGAVLADLKG